MRTVIRAVAGLGEPIELSGGVRAPPLTVRIRRRHTKVALSGVRAHRGTEGSNPSPSSKESATNLTGKIEPPLARNRRFESSPPDCDPAAFTLATVPARFAERGDAWAGIDSAVGSLDALLELSASQEAAGLGDAPWPPHYKKQRDEPPRVAPSRRKVSAATLSAAATSLPSHSSPSPRRRVRRTRSRPRRLEGPVSGSGGAAARGRCSRRLDARPIDQLDSHSDQSAQHPRGRAPARRSART
jgi:hypothetical protein